MLKLRKSFDKLQHVLKQTELIDEMHDDYQINIERKPALQKPLKVEIAIGKIKEK